MAAGLSPICALSIGVEVASDVIGLTMPSRSTCGTKAARIREACTRGTPTASVQVVTVCTHVRDQIEVAVLPDNRDANRACVDGQQHNSQQQSELNFPRHVVKIAPLSQRDPKHAPFRGTAWQLHVVHVHVVRDHAECTTAVI